MAQVLLDGLVKAGFPIVEGLAQHDSYGWSFVIDAGQDEHVWCMLQLSDNWLLIVKPDVSLVRRLLGKRGSVEGLERVSATLRAVGHDATMMTNVRWFATEDDLRRGQQQKP